MSTESTAPGPSYKTYITIWACLVALTAITVFTAGLNFGRLAIIIVLGIAATKSTLVLLYFMHLRWEDRTVIKILMPVVMVTLAIFIGLTYTDILYR
mgnify:CR=1 FL=1